MSKRDLARKEMDALASGGAQVAVAFEQKNKGHDFAFEYQSWYTRALKVVASLAPDRFAEFRGYYEIDPRRKVLGYGTYVIQDFVKGVAPSERYFPDFDVRQQVSTAFANQLAIFLSILERADSILGNIEGELYAELQDSEIAVARELVKVNLRAAGALVGVVIDGHLQKVASAHGVRVTKKNPTISDLNEPLKSASIIDTPTWRKISFLADVRNLCAHKKGTEPTKEQVEDLIQGAEWLAKNVF